MEDHPDTPPPDEARAALHAWLDTADDDVARALWALVEAVYRPGDARREGD